MSTIIYNKAIGSQLLQNSIDNAIPNNTQLLAKKVNNILLTKKIKFPVLEHCATELYTILNEELHIAFVLAEKIKQDLNLLGINIKNKIDTPHIVKEVDNMLAL